MLGLKVKEKPCTTTQRDNDYNHARRQQRQGITLKEGKHYNDMHTSETPLLRLLGTSIFTW